MINFLDKARKLSILPTSLDIFDIRQHYVRILYIDTSNTTCQAYLFIAYILPDIVFFFLAIRSWTNTLKWCAINVNASVLWSLLSRDV